MSLPKVCWIFNGPGLEATGVSGSTLRAQALARRWQDRRLCENYFITTPGGFETQRQLGLEVPTLLLRASIFAKRERFRLTRLYSYLISSIHFYLVRRRVPNYDLVISVSDYFCDVLPAYWLKKAQPKLKWVAWIHHRENRDCRPGLSWVNWCTFRMQRWSFKKISERADQIWVHDTASGREVTRELQHLGVDRERIYAMWNGIESKLIARTPQPERSFDVVMQGLRPNKGLYDVIPVWQEVQKIRPGTTLKMVGNMSDTVRHVLNQVRASGLDKAIKYSGPSSKTNIFPAKDLYRELKSARLFFAPSHEEGWGIVVCEAMACGLAVVAYDLPVYRSIFKDAYVRVPKFDIRLMAENICRLLNKPELYSTYLEQGRVTAKKYDWDRVADGDWRALETLLRE